MTEQTIRITKQEEGLWKSEDGRVMISLDETFETECDDAHPVRMRLDKFPHLKRPLDAKITNRLTKKDGWVQYISYLCPGCALHYYSQWTVEVDGEWTDDVYDTFEQAMGAAERHTGARIVASRTRKPKVEMVRATEIHPVTGAATWVACGHRAEMDINEDCYTCHRSPMVEKIEA